MFYLYLFDQDSHHDFLIFILKRQGGRLNFDTAACVLTFEQVAAFSFQENKICISAASQTHLSCTISFVSKMPSFSAKALLKITKTPLEAD